MNASHNVSDFLKGQDMQCIFRGLKQGGSEFKASLGYTLSLSLRITDVNVFIKVVSLDT